MTATRETLMQPGTLLPLTPALTAEVVSDEWVRHCKSDLGVVVGRVAVLRVGERTARQRFWYNWSAPECPLHHIDMEWVQ